MSITKREFIFEKLNNFRRKIEAFTDIENQPIANKEALLAELQMSASNIEIFATAVENNLKPQRTRIDDLLVEYLAKFNIDHSRIKAEDKETIKLYLNLFIATL